MNNLIRESFQKQHIISMRTQMDWKHSYEHKLQKANNIQKLNQLAASSAANRGPRLQSSLRHNQVYVKVALLYHITIRIAITVIKPKWSTIWLELQQIRLDFQFSDTIQAPYEVINSVTLDVILPFNPHSHPYFNQINKLLLLPWLLVEHNLFLQNHRVQRTP